MIKDLLKKSQEEMCLLQFPRLTDGNSMLPIDIFLKKQYEENQALEAMNKQVTTLVSCILNQNAFYFLLHRDAFRRALNSDKNWPKPIGLSNDKWSNFIKCCISIGLFKEFKKAKNSKGNDVVIWETCKPELLSLLSDSNKEVQLAKIYSFLKQSDRISDRMPDRISDLVNKETSKLVNMENGKNGQNEPSNATLTQKDPPVNKIDTPLDAQALASDVSQIKPLAPLPIDALPEEMDFFKRSINKRN